MNILITARMVIELYLEMEANSSMNEIAIGFVLDDITHGKVLESSLCINHQDTDIWQCCGQKAKSSSKKESFIKQKTRTKFQQLMKSSQLNYHESKEDSDQVEEIPLLIKPAPRTSVAKREKIKGTANMGYTNEEKSTTSLPCNIIEDTEVLAINNDLMSPDRIHDGEEELKFFSDVQIIPESQAEQVSIQEQLSSSISVSRSEKLHHLMPFVRPKAKNQNQNSNKYEKGLDFKESDISHIRPCSNWENDGNGNVSSLRNTLKDNHSIAVSEKPIQNVNNLRQTLIKCSLEDSSGKDKTRSQTDAPHKASTEAVKCMKEEKEDKKTFQKGLSHGSSNKNNEGNTGNKSNVSSANKHSDKEASSLDENVLSVTIHRTDQLETKVMLIHPLVHVHIMDAEKGEYLKKSDRERAVTSFYETQHSNVDYIMPVITQPSKFLEQGLPYPSWEEQLVFNEHFSYFIKENQKVILFFEILEFFKGSAAQKKYHRLHKQCGLKKVAWAFLKLMGANRVVNMGKNLRLQLYKVPTTKLKSSVVDVYYWWSKLSKKPAKSSSLYVSIEPIPLLSVAPALRSMLPIQQESGRTTFEELDIFLNAGVTTSPKVSFCPSSGQVQLSSESSVPYDWTRKPDQPCKVPNKQILSLSTNLHKCFSLKFNNNGRCLASGSGNQEEHFILIYEIPSGSLISKQSAHIGIIYDLDWFTDDKFLLSASADCTVRIWNSRSWECIGILPHPSFVYSAKFHPSVSSMVATACNDHMVRIWTIPSINNAELLKELEAHHCYINSISWNREGSLLFSADSMGESKVWNIEHFGKICNKDSCKKWGIEVQISLPEIKGIAINHIELEPRKERLLLFCRDGTVRLCDWKKGKITRTFSGSVNSQSLLRGSFSPCGTLIFLGGEDGKVHVWDFHTGAIILVYHELHFTAPVYSVVYHPHDHIVAMCCMEESAPILVFQYDPKVPSLQENSFNNVECGSGHMTHDMDFSLCEYQMSPILTASSSKEHLPSKKKINLLDIENSTKSVKPKSLQMFPSASTVKPTIKTKGNFSYSSNKPVLFKTEDRNEDSWDSKSETDLTWYIAIDEYHPQRRDEILLKKGDKISVLKHETENWWIGRLRNGNQGYFPSCCVTTEDNYLADSRDEGTNESSTPSALTAVITKSGKFEIISVPDGKAEISRFSNREKMYAKQSKYLQHSDDKAHTTQPENPKRHRRRNMQKALQKQK